MKKLKNNLLLKSLAPPSITKDPQVKHAISAVEKELLPLEGHLNDGLFYCRIDTLSSDALDHLAAQWNATVWRDSWPIEVKRSVLRALITDKSRLGTLSAVKKAISSLGSGIYVREWWQNDPPREAHTFEVVIDQNAIEGVADADLLFDLRRLIDYAKPVRSQYTFTISFKTYAIINLIGASRPIVHARLSMPVKGIADLSIKAFRVSRARGITSARLSLVKTFPAHSSGQLNAGSDALGRPMLLQRFEAFRGVFEPVYLHIDTFRKSAVRPISHQRLENINKFSATVRATSIALKPSSKKSNSK